MTPDELKEWTYRRDERLGILCGIGQPSAAQAYLAEIEATEALRQAQNELAAIQLRATGQMIMIAALSPLP